MCSKTWDFMNFMKCLVFSGLNQKTPRSCPGLYYSLPHYCSHLWTFGTLPWSLQDISNGHFKIITAVILGGFHIQEDNPLNILSSNGCLLPWIVIALYTAEVTSVKIITPISFTNNCIAQAQFQVQIFQPPHPTFEDHLFLSLTLTIIQLYLDLSLNLQLFYNLFTIPYQPRSLTLFSSTLDSRIHQYHYSLTHIIPHFSLQSSPLAKLWTWLNTLNLKYTFGAARQFYSSP